MKPSRPLTPSLLAVLLFLPPFHGPSAAAGFAPPDAPLERRFASPPAAHRILKIIHGWPDAPEAQDRLRATLFDQGFGGVVCNISFDDYLENDAGWQTFERAVKAAHADGMTLWLYDERGYPSGNAGGLVLRHHPDWEAEGLLVADAHGGPGPITLEIPPGQLVLAAAFPEAPTPDARAGSSAPAPRRVDLPAAVDGRITWTAPEGRWHLVAVTRHRLYEGTHADGNLWQKMPYVNLLRAQPTRRFLEVTHERYAARLGPDLSRWFAATFTDEPSLMSLYFKRMPWRPLPWSPELPAAFHRRHGYALDPILPDLILPLTTPEAARHRHDFWETVGALVSSNYFGQIEAVCRRLNLPSGGHLLAEENIVNHVPLYGDFFRCLREMGSPGIDCLTSLPPDVPWHIARLAASAAELEGRRLVMCETSDHAQVWRPEGDTRPKRTVTEAEIRGTANRLFVAGINVLTSYYSFTGLDTAALRRLNEWVGRCALLLQGGHQVADVAVVYPVQSLWTRFVPAQHWANASAGANRIGHLYLTTLEALFAARREFTIIDAPTLAAAEVRDGVLIHGPLRWRAVALPGVDTLPLAAWRTLERFVETGGVLVAIGNLPANTTDDFPSRRVGRLAARLFGEGGEAAVRRIGRGSAVWLPGGGELLLPGILDGTLRRAFTLHPADAPIRTTHRRVEDRDVLFLINDSPVPWSGEMRLASPVRAHRWDPASGTSAVLPPASTLPLTLEGYGATLLTFARLTPPQAVPLAAGPLAAARRRAIPTGEPTISHGEFVRGRLLPPGPGPEDAGRWQASATLTRGGVDTFLFVRLPVAQPGALADAAAISLETWIPPHQRTPAQLLIILHERGGGDFLAETPRSLGNAEHEHSLVPLSRFNLAGWSQDADGRLDPAAIDEVRIGWGGYHGVEGEQVTFTFAPPGFLPQAP